MLGMHIHMVYFYYFLQKNDGSTTFWQQLMSAKACGLASGWQMSIGNRTINDTSL